MVYIAWEAHIWSGVITFVCVNKHHHFLPIKTIYCKNTLNNKPPQRSYKQDDTLWKEIKKTGINLGKLVEYCPFGNWKIMSQYEMFSDLLGQAVFLFKFAWANVCKLPHPFPLTFYKGPSNILNKVDGSVKYDTCKIS